MEGRERIYLNQLENETDVIKSNSAFIADLTNEYGENVANYNVQEILNTIEKPLAARKGGLEYEINDYMRGYVKPCFLENAGEYAEGVQNAINSYGLLWDNSAVQKAINGLQKASDFIHDYFNGYRDCANSEDFEKWLDTSIDTISDALADELDSYYEPDTDYLLDWFTSLEYDSQYFTTPEDLENLKAGKSVTIYQEEIHAIA